MRRDAVMCSQHRRWEPREGRMWGRDGHLGVNQAKALLWLVWAGVEVHPTEVIARARCGPSQGWGALAVLRDSGCISWVEGDEPLVGVTPIGRRSAADFDDAHLWGQRVDRWPSALDGTPVRPSVVVAASRRRSRHRGTSGGS